MKCCTVKLETEQLLIVKKGIYCSLKIWQNFEMEVCVWRGMGDISREILFRNSKVIYRWSIHFLLYLNIEAMQFMRTVKDCYHKFVRFVLVTIAKTGAGRWIEKVSILTFLTWTFSWKQVKCLSFPLWHNGSLLHLMHVITRAHASTCTTILMHVKIAQVISVYQTYCLESGMKKIKQKTKTSNLMVDHFFFSLKVALPCMTSE